MVVRQQQPRPGWWLATRRLLALLLCCTLLHAVQAQLADDDESTSSSSSSTGNAVLVWWDNTEWLTCSASCGDGLQYNVLRCMTSAGQVDDSLCASLTDIPLIYAQSCNLGDCLYSWRSDLQCGSGYPAPDGTLISICNRDSDAPCCSADQICGDTYDDCTCDTCIDYRVSNTTTKAASNTKSSSASTHTTLIVVLIVVLVGILCLLLVMLKLNQWRQRLILNRANREATMSITHPKNTVRGGAVISVRPIRAFGPSAAEVQAENASGSGNVQTTIRISRSTVAPSPSLVSSVPRVRIDSIPALETRGGGNSYGQGNMLSPTIAMAPLSSRSLVVSPRDILFDEATETPPCRTEDQAERDYSSLHPSSGASVRFHMQVDSSTPTTPSSPLQLIDRQQQLSFGSRSSPSPLPRALLRTPSASIGAGPGSGSKRAPSHRPGTLGPPPQARPSLHARGVGFAASAGQLSTSPSPSPSPPATKPSLLHSASSPMPASASIRALGLGPEIPASSSTVALLPLGPALNMAANPSPPPPSDLCGICFEAPCDALAVPCGHSNFCVDCLTKWSAQRKQCPVCRWPIEQVSRKTPTKPARGPHQSPRCEE